MASFDMQGIGRYKMTYFKKEYIKTLAMAFVGGLIGSAVGIAIFIFLHG